MGQLNISLIKEEYRAFALQDNKLNDYETSFSYLLLKMDRLLSIMQIFRHRYLKYIK